MSSLTKLSDIEIGGQFRWPADDRIFERLKGDPKPFEDRICLLVRPLQPVVNLPAEYLSREVLVEPYMLNFIPIMVNPH